MKQRIPVLVSAMAAAVLFGWQAVEPAASTPRAATAFSTQGGQTAKPGMQMGMQDMAKMHEKMMADMKADQAKLDDLVKKMNAATGDTKVGVMADLLTEIVAGHRRMGERMSGMHEHMMKMGK